MKKIIFLVIGVLLLSHPVTSLASKTSGQELPYSLIVARSLEVNPTVLKHPKKKNKKLIEFTASLQYFGRDLYNPKFDPGYLDSGELLPLAKKVSIGKLVCQFGYTMPEEYYTASEWHGSPTVAYQVEKELYYYDPFPLTDSQIMEQKVSIELPSKYRSLLLKKTRGINTCRLERGPTQFPWPRYMTVEGLSGQERRTVFDRMGDIVGRDLFKDWKMTYTDEQIRNLLLQNEDPEAIHLNYSIYLTNGKLTLRPLSKADLEPEALRH